MQKLNESKIMQVLECIQQKQIKTGCSPSYREIMKLCNISSMLTVQRYIKILKERGELESEDDGKISLDLRFSGKSVSVPLIGTIACGQPIFAVENFEGVYHFPEEFVGRGGDYFMLRAKGDSMLGAGIKDGDMLIIRSQPSADYGQIVAAIIEDEATVKTFRPTKKDTIILHAENPDYDDIEVNTENCRVLGILVSSIRRH